VVFISFDIEEEILEEEKTNENDDEDWEMYDDVD